MILKIESLHIFNSNAKNVLPYRTQTKKALGEPGKTAEEIEKYKKNYIILGF